MVDDIKILPMLAAAANSSVSSHQSETQSLSIAAAGSPLMKSEPGTSSAVVVDHPLFQFGGGGCCGVDMESSMEHEETVTIALDEVMQFAQPTLVTDYY
jgi:hypothetical protein